MREESIRSFIWFGMGLRYLQDVGAGHPIHGANRLVGNIERFLASLEALGMAVTANAAQLEGLPSFLEEIKGTDPGSKLSEAQARKLNVMVNSIKKTLQAESAEKKAFVTSPKRWDVDRLLSDPGSMFGAGVFDQLDALAAFDFGEACKCIAFERPTAGAFHTMRGTEAVLRSFYAHLIKRGRLPKEKQMWGPMLDQLKSRSKPPPKPLLDNLDSIRFNFRNPTQHPDEIYTLDGAQDLLGLVIPAVNRMIELME